MITERLEPRRLLAFPEVDISFGEGGLARVEGYWGDVKLVNALPDGRIVFFASANPDAGDLEDRDDPLVARFNPDGTPDTSFDDDGVLFHAQGDGFSYGSAAALAQGEKIVYLHPAADAFRLFRFNADGTLDMSFGGGDGFVEHALDARSGGSMRVQGDGKILFTYSNGFPQSGEQRLFVGRLNADGSVDTGFRGGIGGDPQWTGLLRGSVAAVAPDGKIYLGGLINPEPDFHPYLEVSVIARLNPDGTPDTSFGGGDGMIDVLPERNYRVVGGVPYNETAGVYEIKPNADGTLLVLGSLERNFMVRFTASGARDTTFGGGDAVTDLGRTQFVPPLVEGPDGKFTIATNVLDRTAGLARINPDGTYDATFGNGGVAEAARTTFRPDAVTFDADGNLLFAGREPIEGGYSGNFAISRLVTGSADVVLSPQGHLFVNTTDSADTILVERAGDQLLLRRNGVTTPYAAEDVTALTIYPSGGGDVITLTAPLKALIQTGDGNDSITVGTGVTSVTVEGGAGNDRLSLADGDHTIEAGDGNDTVTAGDGDHTIGLGGGDDRLTTAAGNNTVWPGTGNDTVTTGPGGDYVHAGGNTTIVTSSGNDTIYTGSGDDLVFAGAGHDLIGGSTSEYSVGTGNKVYFGGDGDDVMAGSSGANSLFGGAGHDTLHGAQGDDYINGGAGDDELGGRNDGYFAAQSGRDTLVGGEGHDRIDGGDGDDLLFGDGGDDTIHGANGNNVVHGGAGADSLEGGFGDLQAVLDETPAGAALAGGVLTFNGTAGDDAISIWADGANLVFWRDGSTQTFPLADVKRIALAGNGGNDLLKLHAQLGIPAVLIGGAGDDELIGGRLGDTLLGGDGADHLFGNAGSDHADGGFGADVMRGGLGFDTLDYGSRGGRLVVGLDNFQDDGEAGENDLAGPDFEKVLGGVGDDRIGGGSGNEHLYGGMGNDVVSGGGGNDYLFGIGGNDTISGDAGDDALFGDAGHDSLVGGAGNNAHVDLDAAGVLRFHGSDVADQISLWQLSERDHLVVWLNGVTHAIDYPVVQRIELNGYGGNDVLKLNVGLAVYSVLRGGSGDDHVTGGFYPDTILGGDGNDTLVGGKSLDTIYGNAGNDTVDFSLSKQPVRVTLDDLQDDGEIDSHGEAENDLVAPDIENVVGTRFADSITGNAAANALSGGGGADALYGQAGNDTLRGGDGDDYLEGGAGDDALHGDGGADGLFGLAGNDRFFAADGSADTVRGGPGVDGADADRFDDVLAVETVS